MKATILLFISEQGTKGVITLPNISPSIETHLAVVRELPTKKFRSECVNEKSSTERHS